LACLTIFEKNISLKRPPATAGGSDPCNDSSETKHKLFSKSARGRRTVCSHNDVIATDPLGKYQMMRLTRLRRKTRFCWRKSVGNCRRLLV